jgi:hypothetical protein
MPHPVVSIFVVIYVVEVFSFGRFRKERVRFEKANVVVDSPRKNFTGSVKELLGGLGFVFI